MITLQKAKDISDLESVFKLRFECQLNRDLALEEYLAEGMLKEVYDEQAAIYIAKEGEEVVGAVRLLQRKDGEFPYDWCYDYQIAAEVLNTPPPAFMIRFAYWTGDVLKKAIEGVKSIGLCINWLIVTHAL